VGRPDTTSTWDSAPGDYGVGQLYTVVSADNYSETYQYDNKARRELRLNSTRDDVRLSVMIRVEGGSCAGYGLALVYP
jgi:hypothetical protein